MLYIVLWQKDGKLEKEIFTTEHKARGYAKYLIKNKIPDSLFVDITKIVERWINTSIYEEEN